MRTTGKPEQAEDGRVVRVYGNIMDISEQKEAEEKHRQLEEQLQQAQKMEAVGRLAGGIAHDFNNLLSVIIGYSEILLEEIREDQPQHPPLQQIQNASNRARDLVRQLLAFSRKQILEIRSLDINRVITGFENFIGRVIDEDIHLDLNLSDTPVFVEADAAQLEQVLMNMVINARDAMPGGGRLTIETAAVNLDELADADKPIDAGGCHAVVTVGDTGTGMDADTRSRAFEPFFTTKEKEKGTGLGLATCYGIIKQHGGDIRIDSKPGQGARFRIYLPCTPAQQPERQPTGNPGEEPPAGDSANILVVEDDPSVLNLACSVLEKNGYRVKSAGDAQTAVTHAKNNPGPLHLVLTDVIMPEMKGPEVCREVARYHPGIKVIYMSGYTDNIISGQVSPDQGAEFIQKPFSIRELGEKVRRVLEK
ncbi:MAG: response regulator [Desulfobacteraceae bacterium]|nr:response regulator [Desulfobacteraceae bacterium]